jgi:hypothetical protein
MGVFKAQTIKKVYIFELENRGRTKELPLSLFQLVKRFLDGLHPSRAHLRFTLQNKDKLSSLNRLNMLLTESLKN